MASLSYLTPGVYVEEVAGGTRPIEAVGTSTAGFVGVAPDASARANEVVAINNWGHFVRVYASGDDVESTHLSQAVYGFFLNGGSRCYVVNVGAGGSLVGSGRKRTGLDLLEQIDEVAIVAAPGYTDAASYDALLTHCERLEDRVAALDGPPQARSMQALTEVATASASRRRSGDGEGEGGEGEGGEDAGSGGGGGSSGGQRPRMSDGGYGAVYFPWITVRDPFATDELVEVPPSGHVAGIWARTDATRGVYKAPANELVRGALNVTYRLTRAEQGELNPNGVNCIRMFPREGIRVWGARTVADSASEWRYLSVRRFFNMVKESIAEGTRWVVFEPNDETLWKSIRRDITAFLMRMWREGALMGQTPEQAFFVKCDAETNPPDSIDAGFVVTLIGMAVVKPAEFIVFRLSQYQGGLEVDVEEASTEGGGA